MNVTLGERRPLAVQLRDELLALAAREGWAAGDRIASEHVLAERFNVGRTTVREAFKLLEQDGYVRSQQGRGRFLAVPILDRPVTRLEGVTEMMSASGLEPSNQVLSLTTSTPTHKQQGLLGLKGDAAVVCLERLRCHESDPMVYSLDYFSESLLDRPIDQVDFTGSLFAVFEQAGTHIDRAVARVQAVSDLPTGDVETPGPWLLLEQEHLDTGGRVVLLSSDYHRAGAFTFSLIRRREL